MSGKMALVNPYIGAATEGLKGKCHAKRFRIFISKCIYFY
jgi:hypothetical protein